MRYFPFKPTPAYEILDASQDYSGDKTLVVGGGGLGTHFFAPHLDRITRQPHERKLIAWGVGVDNVVDMSGKVLDPTAQYDLYGNWFDAFDEVGIRVWGNHPRYKWIPCSSCLHPAFFKFRDIKPTQFLGVYNHKRLPLVNPGETDFSLLDNAGDNIVEKLEFLSRHEYILTNTYHGVYWATLLNRKAICVPFKSGLFSFKHKPAYSTGSLNDELFHQAQSYPDSLEECRTANIDFYTYLMNKYGDI
ncbi:MAG: hypothetical protein ACM3SV_03690 [Betaproteobacteria bacterium]